MAFTSQADQAIEPPVVEQGQTAPLNSTEPAPAKSAIGSRAASASNGTGGPSGGTTGVAPTPPPAPEPPAPAAPMAKMAQVAGDGVSSSTTATPATTTMGPAPEAPAPEAPAPEAPAPEAPAPAAEEPTPAPEEPPPEPAPEVEQAKAEEPAPEPAPAEEPAAPEPAPAEEPAAQKPGWIPPFDKNGWAKVNGKWIDTKTWQKDLTADQKAEIDAWMKANPDEAATAIPGVKFDDANYQAQKKAGNTAYNTTGGQSAAAGGDTWQKSGRQAVGGKMDFGTVTSDMKLKRTIKRPSKVSEDINSILSMRHI